MKPHQPRLLGEFKTFLLRGNAVDLAVAVVIGAAFNAVVQALVKDLVTPIVSIPGTVNFSDLRFIVHRSVFAYGDFLNATLTFVTVAAAVFFGVVKPINVLVSRHRSEPAPAAATRECPECLSKIPTAARRCAFCTAEVGPAVS